MRKLPPLLMTIFALTACSGNTAGETASAVTAACEANTNATAQACDCLGTKAEEQLSPEAAQWLAASLNGDTEKARQMKDNVPWTELLEASTFMLDISDGCAIPALALVNIEE